MPRGKLNYVTTVRITDDMRLKLDQYHQRKQATDPYTHISLTDIIRGAIMRFIDDEDGQ